MRQKTPIAVRHGDGIGPEIMESSLHIIQESGATLEIETIAEKAVTHAQISALYEKVTAAGYDIVKTKTLRTFDGQQGFTLAQGQ